MLKGDRFADEALNTDDSFIALGSSGSESTLAFSNPPKDLFIYLIDMGLLYNPKAFHPRIWMNRKSMLSFRLLEKLSA